MNGQLIITDQRGDFYRINSAERDLLEARRLIVRCTGDCAEKRRVAHVYHFPPDVTWGDIHAVCKTAT